VNHYSPLSTINLLGYYPLVNRCEPSWLLRQTELSELRRGTLEAMALFRRRLADAQVYRRTGRRWKHRWFPVGDGDGWGWMGEMKGI